MYTFYYVTMYEILKYVHEFLHNYVHDPQVCTPVSTKVCTYPQKYVTLVEIRDPKDNTFDEYVLYLGNIWAPSTG
jgi:hypothetical protein